MPSPLVRSTRLLACALLCLCGGLTASLHAGGFLRAGFCPHCNHWPCAPTPTTTKVSKHYWEIETKQICIPHITWPWAPCCQPPKCGRVRVVRSPKKVPYECEKCGYKWEVNCGPDDQKGPPDADQSPGTDKPGDTDRPPVPNGLAPPSNGAAPGSSRRQTTAADERAIPHYSLSDAPLP